jgi:hypothetical protein
VWGKTGATAWFIPVGGVLAFLAFGFIGPAVKARALALDRRNFISSLFAGAQKSVRP